MTSQTRRSAGPRAFADTWASASQSGMMPIPDVLRGSEALVVAVVTREGALKDANRGFLLLMTGSTCAPEPADVWALFASPTFDELGARPIEPFDRTIYRGLLSFGTAGGKITSLRGAVYGHEGDYVVVAEHDIARLETLRTTLLELQDDLTMKQRRIAHLEQRIAELQELAEAALRDRDTLLDALAHREVPTVE